MGALKKKFGHYFSWAFFLIPFFHKKLRPYYGESQVFVMISVLTQFFFIFQNKYKVKSLNHDENIKMLMLKKHKFTTKYAAIYGNRVNKVV